MKSNHLKAIGIPVFLALAVAGCSREQPAAPKSPPVSSTPSSPSTMAPSTTSPSASTSSTSPSTSMGQKVDDATITAKVKSALLADSAVKGTDINVDTSGGVVTLKGAVDSQTQIDDALRVARAVEGVSTVQNQLMVKK